MRDTMREPNLDPNSYTEVPFAGFKYLKYIRNENKDEWVERQMANEIIRNSILGVKEGRYEGIKSEEVENQDEYCKIVLEHKWDQLFKKEYDEKELEKRKHTEVLIKLRRKYPSLKGYTHINEYNQFTIQAYLPDVIKFVGIKSLIKKGWFSGIHGYDIKGRLIKIFSFSMDSFVIELPQKKSEIEIK